MREPAGRRCPICGRAAEARYKPFCSARCANLDLSRWLNESYRIPARPDADEEDSASEGDIKTESGRGTSEAPASPVEPTPGRRRKPS